MTEQIEEWKIIQEFPNYSISGLGRLRNDKTGKLLNPNPNNKGAFKYTFPNNSQRLLHRIMAQTFLENPNDYPVVDHIDRNPSNNVITNLRWVTQANNIRNYTKAEGKLSKFKGVNFHKGNNRFRAFVTWEGKMKTIGYYKTELDAAKGYNDFITSHNLNEFTPLNALGELENSP